MSLLVPDPRPSLQGLDPELLLRESGLDIRELCCNGRRYGLRRGGNGSKISFGWNRKRYAIYREVERNVEEYIFKKDMIEECEYAKAKLAGIVFKLSKDLYEQENWRCRDERDMPIRLTILAELTGDSSTSDDNEKSDQGAWQRLTEQLSELPSCKQIGVFGMRSLLYPLEQTVYECPLSMVRWKSMARVWTPEGWLNDELMAAGLGFVQQDTARDDAELAARTLFLNAHWWQKLDRSKGKTVLLRDVFKMHKKDIFGLDYILAPVNIGRVKTFRISQPLIHHSVSFI
ncbi:hypothetical protein FRC08_015333 [Ceratobasidium sp. 394]|nr:hypothetical protein FRC08_015333 [Ceratobasidium sp. 394]